MEQGRIVKVAGPLVVAEGLGTAKMFDLVQGRRRGAHGRDHRDARRPRLDPGVRGDRGPRPGRPRRSPPVRRSPSSSARACSVPSTTASSARSTSSSGRRARFWPAESTRPGLTREKRVGVRGHGQRSVTASSRATSSASCRRTPSSSTASWCRRESAARSSRSRAAPTRSSSPSARLRTDGGDEVPLLMMQTLAGADSAALRASKVSATEPLVTGTRVIDTFFPLVKGGAGVHPGAVRRRQDRHPAPGRQVEQRADRHLHRLRRARQRDDRRAHGVPRARGPVLGRAAHEAHRARRQHLQHAGRRARGERLHGHHDGRVLPRHGLRGRAPGRLDVPLGRGDARDLGPSRGDAGRGRLPGLPRHAARGVLRARRQGRDAGWPAAGERAIRHRADRAPRRRVHPARRDMRAA